MIQKAKKGAKAVEVLVGVIHTNGDAAAMLGPIVSMMTAVPELAPLGKVITTFASLFGGGAGESSTDLALDEIKKTLQVINKKLDDMERRTMAKLDQLAEIVENASCVQKVKDQIEVIDTAYHLLR